MRVLATRRPLQRAGRFAVVKVLQSVAKSLMQLTRLRRGFAAKCLFRLKNIVLLKQIAPRLRTVAMLWNADDLGMTLRYRASETGAQALGISVQALGVREPNDFEQAFAAMKSDLPDGILMVSDALTLLNRKRVFEFAAAHRLPAIYEDDRYVRDGGLMSYGPDQSESFARVAALVDRILKGAKPAELPFEQPTRFRFVLNLKTAKSLGLEVPPTLLALADEVME
jgi:ABC-type uncharacterized transport system substrate-binding protein